MSSPDDGLQPTTPPAEQANGTLHIVAEAVYTISEVCRRLRISDAQYHALRKRGRWPIPELQPSLGDARFAGAEVLRYLHGDFASVRGRRAHVRSVA